MRLKRGTSQARGTHLEVIQICHTLVIVTVMSSNYELLKRVNLVCKQIILPSA